MYGYCRPIRRKLSRLIQLLEELEPGDSQHFGIIKPRLMALPDEALQTGTALIVFVCALVD